MALDINRLISDARCVDRCVPSGMQTALLIALMQRVAEDSGTFSGTADLVNAGYVPIAHGLGQTPSVFAAGMECISNDAASGYAAGDRTLDSSLRANPGGRMLASVTADSQYVYFLYDGNPPALAGNEATTWIIAKTGDRIAPTSWANFRYWFYAHV